MHGWLSNLKRKTHMAILTDKYYNATLQFEGLFCDVKGDAGGMTYCGIARNMNPQWVGWKEVDKVLAKKKVKYNERIPEADPYVKDFYLENFFNKAGLHFFGDDDIAGHLFDIGVNSGTKRAKMLLQEALGVTVDGLIGPMTIKAVSQLPKEEVIKRLREVREKFYKGIVSRKPDQGKFLDGWLRRARNYPKM